LAAVEPIEVVRAIYEAMAARELDRLFQLLHPDIVVTQDAALPWTVRDDQAVTANFAIDTDAMLRAIDAV